MKVTDPFCHMEIKIEKAVAQTGYNGRTYYFCANACLRQFEQHPETYLRNKTRRPG